MLSQLQIRDFAIVEQLELEFEPGLSTITGETGAGKSIMIDALGLLLGDRADSVAIRQPSQRAAISASFDLRQVCQAREWLAERGLESDGDDCHLRRLLYRNGRSRAYINGASQPLQALRELGELLVDIHSQHEHQSLLKRNLQRQLLDDYADHQALVMDVEKAFAVWRQAELALSALHQAAAEREARLDALRYQVRELQTLDLQEGEADRLQSEQRRLAHVGRLLESGQQALEKLYDGDTQPVHGTLARLIAEFSNLSALDERLQSPLELLNGALIQVSEASDELRDYLHHLELDPQRHAWVEQRLSAIHGLARKHRVAIDELPRRLEQLVEELAALENSEARQEQLQRSRQAAWQHYQHLAGRLHDSRAAAAAELGSAVTRAMQELGMPGGRFAVHLQAHGPASAQGIESVEFVVSANPGQPLMPLAKVASGGELSRISLAIQVIAADATRVPTLIFDEVDSGIGGAVAEVVGRLLRRLGRSRQVLCVTHLPQVAAQAHHHLRVTKQTGNGATTASVASLNDVERAAEIARMLGGLTLTDNTLNHAREMIAHAQRG